MTIDELRALPDHEILGRLRVLVACARDTEADLVAHLAQADSRALYEPRHPSMDEYCRRDLGFSEAETTARLAVARECRSPPGPAPRPAPESPRIQFAATPQLREKLREAQDLLRHQIPTGNLAAVIDLSLTLLIVELKKERHAARTKPRAPQPRDQ